jgi:hypothetical protein
VHEKNGRDEKLTDVYDARVIRELVSWKLACFRRHVKIDTNLALPASEPLAAVEDINVIELFVCFG